MAPARAIAALVALAAFCSGCGGDEPPSAVTPAQFKASLQGAPPPLARLYSRPSEIVNGGPAAFRRQLASLRGYPVVVNKWASWCGPCRFEFPFFQRLARRMGTRVAFMGVDSLDSRDGAKRFLARYPVPYPSFFDPKGEVAKVFRGERVAPTTAFYDRSGELVFTKQGGYASESAIKKDLDRYAG
jgi:cytochrome c biogenesis protein CcmG/thiol:disulfide interchange protein DsbE